MKRHLPSLNALRAFESAARLGRMNSAADELSVTPGAISRQIRQLELDLGVALFEGSKIQPRLTSQGQALLPALTSALDQIEAAVRAATNQNRGTIDVSCFSTLTVKWLIPRLYLFNRLHPDIEIRLSASEHATDPDASRHDVVITVDDASNVDRIDALALFPERLGLVLSPSLAAGITLVNPQDIVGKPILHTKTRLNAWQMWGDSLGYACPKQSGPEFEHYYFTIEAAVSGLGLCVAPWHLVMDDVVAGRLVAPLGFQESGFEYIMKRKQQPEKKLEVFCAWMKEQALAMPSPDSPELWFDLRSKGKSTIV